MGPRDARASGRRRALAVALALVVHLGMFAFLLTGGGRLQFLLVPQPPAAQVWLAPPTILRSQPVQPQAAPTQSRRAPPQASAPAAAAPAPALSTSAAPSAPSPTANGPGAAAPVQPGAGISAALRGRVGCAQPETPWMTDADRAACRDRLAAGAARAPHLEGMPPVKLAYFNAVAKAQADWLSGRDAGHGLAIGCIKQVGPGVRTAPPPHALRLGPCMIEPPRGSLNVDSDILPNGDTAKAPPAFLTTGHGPFSRPGT